MNIPSQILSPFIGSSYCSFQLCHFCSLSLSCPFFLCVFIYIYIYMFLLPHKYPYMHSTRYHTLSKNTSRYILIYSEKINSFSSRNAFSFTDVLCYSVLLECSFCICTCQNCSVFFFFIAKAGLQRGGETERNIFHPLIHSPSGHHGQSCSNTKSGA